MTFPCGSCLAAACCLETGVPERGEMLHPSQPRGPEHPRGVCWPWGAAKGRAPLPQPPPALRLEPISVVGRRRCCFFPPSPLIALGEGPGEVSCVAWGCPWQRTGTDGSQRFTSSIGATPTSPGPKWLHPGPVRRWERGDPAARPGWAAQGSHPAPGPVGRALELDPAQSCPKPPGHLLGSGTGTAGEALEVPGEARCFMANRCRCTAPRLASRTCPGC